MCRNSSILIVLIALALAGRAQDESGPAQENPPAKQGSAIANSVFSLFNMAGTQKTKEFRPQTQAERNRRFLTSMINPLSFVRVAASAGIDQAKDKPFEWEQGASGYGKRYANILGQYSIQRTATYGLESALHEDNRYFNSGKQGFWARTGYAFGSGILARRDDGSRRFSISQAGGVAAGAFLARTWLPASQNSPVNALTSFGITMGTNIGIGVMKEFLPDVIRPLTRKRSNP